MRDLHGRLWKAQQLEDLERLQETPPMAEPPLDPPEDEAPECPVCDAILKIATRQLASCGACGWSNDPDWSMQDDQD